MSEMKVKIDDEILALVKDEILCHPDITRWAISQNLRLPLEVVGAHIRELETMGEIERIER